MPFPLLPKDGMPCTHSCKFSFLSAHIPFTVHNEQQLRTGRLMKTDYSQGSKVYAADMRLLFSLDNPG